MQTEIEAKFLNVKHDTVRELLQELGAELIQPNRLMRRKNFDYPDKRLEKEFAGWIRVRDEGDKVTLAYKQLNDRTLHGTKEVNITVDDFEQACQLLESIGFEVQSYQETKRESWELAGVQIELDEWPWINQFIEIEAPNETELRSTAEKLGFDMGDALHGSVEIVYQAEFNVSEEEVDHWPEILFTPVPDWLEAKRKK